MNHRNYMKPSVVLPVIIGLIIGTALFLLGEADDAPGLCLIGLIVAFLLILRGIYNLGAIKKSTLTYLLPLCFGGGCLVMSILLQLEGELAEIPSLFFIGVLLGAVLIYIGVIKLIKSRE